MRSVPDSPGKNVDVLRRAYEAFSEGRFPLDHLDRAVVWDESRRQVDPAVHHGHEGARRVFESRLEVFDDFRVEAEQFFDLGSSAEEVLSPNLVFFGPRAPRGLHGLEAFRDFIADLRRDAPDLRFAELETVVEGRRIASVFTMTRSHPTGEGETKTIVTEGMDLFGIAHGKIHQVNAYFDRLGLLVEMGVLEVPVGVATSD